MKNWARVKALFRRKQLEKDLDEELAFHLAMREEKKRAAGVAAEEAKYAARREFGNAMRVKEICRELWSFASLEMLWRDLRYGARALAKNPGFTVVAVLAIALGIGVNTWIFSVLNGVAVRLLPIPRAEQIVSVDQILHGKVSRNVHGEPGLSSYSEYKNYRDHNHVFTGLLAYEPFLQATLGGGSPKQLMGAAVSCNYFDVLEERPGLGRVFVDADCSAPGASAVVVLSDDLWKSRFGADPSIVGKSVSLNRAKFTVIGIAVPGFGGLDPWPSEFWAPVTTQKALEPDRDFFLEDNTGWLAMLGRMPGGVSIEEVRSDLGVIAGQIDQQYPGRTTRLAIHRATFLGRPEERSFVFAIGAVVLAAVGLVLLIACANVANLLLARASARQKEIAIRLSIGGSRWQIVRQLLTESLLISFLGGTLGSLIAFWSMEGIAQFVLAHLPHGAPRLVWNVNPDLRVWGYSLGLTALTGIVFGLAPALHATRQDLSTAIKGDGGFIGKAAAGGMLRSTLVGVQVAVCMVLLISPGLFTVLGMPMVWGRGFTKEETQSDAGVMVMTESTARRLWPGQDAVGKTLRGFDKKEYQVVGVVKDAQVSHLGEPGGMFFYIPAGPKEQERLQLLVHSKSGDTATANGIQESARALDPDLIVDVTRLEDNLELWRTPSRIVAALSGVLGGLALLLASIGVYGVVSYGVSQRLREIGIRMTLGADGREVMTLLLRQAMRPVVIGALIGIVGCAAVSQVLSKVLYGIGSHDPIAFIGVPVFLLGIALLASYIPARRATRVDPVVALRYE